jgi:hypothetical protein
MPCNTSYADNIKLKDDELGWRDFAERSRLTKSHRKPYLSQRRRLRERQEAQQHWIEQADNRVQESLKSGKKHDLDFLQKSADMAAELSRNGDADLLEFAKWLHKANLDHVKESEATRIEHLSKLREQSLASFSKKDGMSFGSSSEGKTSSHFDYRANSYCKKYRHERNTYPRGRSTGETDRYVPDYTETSFDPRHDRDYLPLSPSADW